MTKRKIVILGISVAVLGISAATLGLLVVWNWLSQPIFKDQEHLPDEVLIQNFRNHRSEFEQIRSMLERDEHIFRIDEDWTDPANLPKEQVEEYRRLFAIVGTPRGFYNRRNPFRIELLASARGWVTSGSMKGYVYLNERPKEGVVTSLDGFHNGADHSWRSALRHIEGNWYLFFER